MFWISSLLAGFSICLLLYVIFSPAAGRLPVPAAFRKRKLFVLFWPWIDVLGRVIMPFVPWRHRERIQSLLRHAGLENMACVDHILGIQCLAAGIAFAISLFVQRSDLLGHPMTNVIIAGAMATGAYFLPLLWLRDRAVRRRSHILRELPFFLDMTTLCVEAGQNLQGALAHTAALCPAGILREELRYSLGEMRAGKPRIDALKAMAFRTGTPEIGRWVAAIAQAENLGMGLGPLLRSQSEQRRQERFSLAEKRALEAPVKMLMPLIFCIFPCTFIVLAFPIAVKVLQSGI